MIRMDDFLGGDLRIVWGDQIADCTIRSDEGAQASDGLSNNEGIHLSRALIRVDCLRVGDKAADMVVEQDTVAAEQFAGIADRFSAFDSAEQSEACSSCMRPSSCNCAKRSIIVCVDVTFPSIRTRRSCTSLKPADRLAELHPLGGVAQRVLIGAHLTADRKPRNACAGHAQHLCRVRSGRDSLW